MSSVSSTRSTPKTQTQKSSSPAQRVEKAKTTQIETAPSQVDPQKQVDARTKTQATEAASKARANTEAPSTPAAKKGLQPTTTSAPQSPVEQAAQDARRADVEHKKAEKAASALQQSAAQQKTDLVIQQQQIANKYQSALQRQGYKRTPLGPEPSPQMSAAAYNAIKGDVERYQKNAAQLKQTEAQTTAALGRAETLKSKSLEAKHALSEETKATMSRAIANKDQAVVDELTRAAELAGGPGARAMGDAAASVLAQHPTAAREVAQQLKTSVEQGNGALFGVRTAQSMLNRSTPGAERVARSVGEGVANVRESFETAQAQVDQHQAQSAQFMAVHGRAMSPQQQQTAQAEFAKLGEDHKQALDDAARKLISTGQGARAMGAEQTLDLMSGALSTDAGQRYLKDTLKTTPQGELPSHLVARSTADAKRLSAPLSSAVMGEREPALRAQSLADVAKHSEQLGMPELADGRLQTQLKQAANGRDIGEIKNAVSAAGAILQKAGKFDSATGKFGASLALAASALNVSTADGVKQVAQSLNALTKETASVSGEFLDSVGKNSNMAKRIATVTGVGGTAFDTLNAVNAFAKGEHVSGALAAASAVGNVLSFAGKRALGGYIGLAATIGEVGYDAFKSAKAVHDYRQKARPVLEKLGFDPSTAKQLSKMNKDSSVVLREIGKGQGPDGRDLSSNDVLSHIRDNPKQTWKIANLNNALERKKDSELKREWDGRIKRRVVANGRTIDWQHQIWDIQDALFR